MSQYEAFTGGDGGAENPQYTKWSSMIEVTIPAEQSENAGTPDSNVAETPASSAQAESVEQEQSAENGERQRTRRMSDDFQQQLEAFSERLPSFAESTPEQRKANLEFWNALERSVKKAKEVELKDDMLTLGFSERQTKKVWELFGNPFTSDQISGVLRTLAEGGSVQEVEESLQAEVDSEEDEDYKRRRSDVKKWIMDAISGDTESNANNS